MKLKNSMLVAALAVAAVTSAQTTTVTFRNGLNGYTGSQDGRVLSDQPDNLTTGVGVGVLFTDWPDGGSQNWTHQTLIKFADIIGSNPGQIPANATITKAILKLNALGSGTGSSTNAQGDGGTFYRMVMDWNEATATWNSFGGNGIQPNDVEARATASVQLGIAFANLANAAGIGQGPVFVDVTGDVQAWANGEANYGWAQLPLDGGTDGWGFAPHENPNEAARPTLEVTYTLNPAGLPNRSIFQRGVDGYNSVIDAYISNDLNQTDSEFGFSEISWVDQINVNDPAASDQGDWSMIKFGDLFGSNSGQVPAGADILKATLVLQTSGTTNAPGDGGSFHKLLNAWTEEFQTYNSSFGGNGIQADGVEAAIPFFAQAGFPARTPNTPSGLTEIDVTTDIEDWQAGIMPNHGWAVIPWLAGTDGWIYLSSDCLVQELRPKLVIEWGTLAKVSGTITLGDYFGTVEGQPVWFEVVDGNGNVVHSVKRFLRGTTGEYSLKFPAFISSGTYGIRVKGAHWLSKLETGVSVAAPNTTTLNFTLINGDVDGDNEVGPGDFGALATAFLSVAGDPNWNVNADLDGDGEVGPGDFSILANNFLNAGE